MKEGHYLLIFFAVIVVSMITLDHRMESLSVMSQKNESYDKGTEDALVSAYNRSLDCFECTSADLLTDFYSDDDKGIFEKIIDNSDLKSSIVDYFFKELYAKYNAYRNEIQQTRIQTSFPVIAFVDTDGISVNYIKQNAKGQIFRVFSDEIPWGDKEKSLKECKKGSDDYYEYWKEIEDTLNYFANNFGNRGEPLQEGVSVVLNDVGNNIDLVGTEFVGIYVVSLTTGAYDHHTMSYRLVDLNKLTLADMPYYFIGENKSTGILEYHVNDCDEVNIDHLSSNIKSSKEDCAKSGAYPCAVCKP